MFGPRESTLIQSYQGHPNASVFLTMPSSPRARLGIARQMCSVFIFALSPRGKCLGWQTWQCNVKHYRLHEKTAVILPAGCPSSVGVIAWIGWMKSQSPHYSPGQMGERGYKRMVHNLVHMGRFGRIVMWISMHQARGWQKGVGILFFP